MGPIAGLAAGLGIAALLSHFGMGAGLAKEVIKAGRKKATTSGGSARKSTRKPAGSGR